MSKQNRNQRGDSNGRESNNPSQAKADELITSMETDPAIELQHQELEDARQLGAAIRDSSAVGLPTINPGLRELLSSTLDENAGATEATPESVVVKNDASRVVEPSKSKWIAVAASLFAIVGIGTVVTLASNGYFQQQSENVALVVKGDDKSNALADKNIGENVSADGIDAVITDNATNLDVNRFVDKEEEMGGDSEALESLLSDDLTPRLADALAPVNELGGESKKEKLLTSERASRAMQLAQLDSQLNQASGLNNSGTRSSKDGLDIGRDGEAKPAYAQSGGQAVGGQGEGQQTQQMLAALSNLSGGEKGKSGIAGADSGGMGMGADKFFEDGAVGGISVSPSPGGMGGGMGGGGMGGGMGGGGFGGGRGGVSDFGLRSGIKGITKETTIIVDGEHSLEGKSQKTKLALNRIKELESRLQILNGRLGPGHRDIRALTSSINEWKKRYRDDLNGSNNEQYDSIFENRFKTTKGASALSTFSIDVDTASYSNMRRFINQGGFVPPNSIRIEELVNYFDYDYPQPKGEDPFSVNMELATCPWNEQHKILRVGLKGKEIHRDERPASNIVFLLDVSGSMSSEDKLPLLKAGFKMMVKRLNENDRVSIVTYAGNAGIALEPTTGDQKATILGAIENLNAGGSTNGSQGIELAYQLAQKRFIKDGTNKVILATDGDLNVGITADNDLVKLIKEKASEGVFLSVLGFGTGNLKDSKMEKLADNGNGMYSYIDGMAEAHKVLVQNMSGSLVTIAKDVKIQIEFNPAEVKSYRLIGYENRILATKDFDNDKKDAGEIGAGHTVTALYELVTTDSAEATTAAPAKLKYQGSDEPTDAEVGKASGDVKISLMPKKKNLAPGEMLTLALRYKQPDENESKRIEFTLKNESKTFSTASPDFKFASSVAAFGMLLRGSQYSGTATKKWVQEVAAGSIGDDISGYRREFVDLVRRYNRSH